MLNYIRQGGTLRLATTATGIDVTGTVTATTATGSSSPTPTKITIATSTSAGDWSTTAPWGRLAFYSADASAGGAKEEVTLDVVAAQAAGGVSDFTINTYNSGAKERLRISHDGNLSLYEDTGTTPKFFWDASAESLGIGTSTVNADLHLGAASPHIDIGPSTGNRGKIGYNTNNVYIGSTSGTGEIHFKNNIGSTDAPNASGDTKMVIADSGVGIGTSSPFSVNGTNLEVSDALYSRLILDSTAGTRYSIQSLNDSSLGIYDLDADSERLRIDSSGNLLVGKSTTAIETAGINLFGTGRIIATADEDDVVVLNRKTSDGDIAVFKKDGATVGSIGTVGGVLTIGNGDTGLLFSGSGDYITPRNATTQAGRDAAIDLGTASDRFKDLYLSGGVVFGTTGGAVSSKTLDDYEEGTWTPAYTGSSTSPTGITQFVDARYAVVGRAVHCVLHTYMSAFTGGSGDVRINLPFAANSATKQSGAVGRTAGWGTTKAPRAFLIEASGTFLTLLASDSADNRDNLNDVVQYADMTTYDEIYICFTYFLGS